jgi:hypothetical protein
MTAHGDDAGGRRPKASREGTRVNLSMKAAARANYGDLIAAKRWEQAAGRVGLFAFGCWCDRSGLIQHP